MDEQAKLAAPAPIQRAGWPLRDWLAAAGFGQTKFFELEGDDAPHKVRIGRKILVIEAPNAYLRRMAQKQLEAA